MRPSVGLGSLASFSACEDFLYVFKPALTGRAARPETGAPSLAASLPLGAPARAADTRRLMTQQTSSTRRAVVYARERGASLG